LGFERFNPLFCGGELNESYDEPNGGDSQENEGKDNEEGDSAIHGSEPKG
jgi:hypothetical protein